MKRLTALTLALLLALSLSACKKAEEAPRTPVPAAPADVETPREGFTTLTGDAFEPTNVKSISASAVVTEGRIPEGEYDLPEEVTRQSDLMISGGIALLAELPEEDIGFYGLEGKEFYPALIRWEDSLAEFDWLYMTPRCVEPRLWCFDFDGDGEEELVVDCYYASGTGVSMSDLHVVEKNADGTLTAYTFPADVLMPALGGYTCLVKAGNDDYVVLGGEMVHITELPGGEKLDLKKYDLTAGSILGFEKTEQGMECSVGIALEGEGLHHWYVADVTADILYQDGKFILDGFHLDGY